MIPMISKHNVKQLTKLVPCNVPIHLNTRRPELLHKIDVFTISQNS